MEIIVMILIAIALIVIAAIYTATTITKLLATKKIAKDFEDLTETLVSNAETAFKDFKTDIGNIRTTFLEEFRNTRDMVLKEYKKAKRTFEKEYKKNVDEFAESVKDEFVRVSDVASNLVDAVDGWAMICKDYKEARKENNEEPTAKPED